MIKIEKKNKWAIDLSLHIPIPSFSFAITGAQEEEIQNTELKYNAAMDSQSDQADLSEPADAVSDRSREKSEGPSSYESARK